MFIFVWQLLVVFASETHSLSFQSHLLVSLGMATTDLTGVTCGTATHCEMAPSFGCSQRNNAPFYESKVQSRCMRFKATKTCVSVIKPRTMIKPNKTTATDGRKKNGNLKSQTNGDVPCVSATLRWTKCYVWLASAKIAAPKTLMTDEHICKHSLMRCDCDDVCVCLE